MRYTVVWHQLALDEVADLWLKAEIVQRLREPPTRSTNS